MVEQNTKQLMVDLFEFEVHKKALITESYIEQFITEFLDSHSSYWGGGYDLYKINGTISIDENDNLNIASIINDFANYFSEEDLITINLYGYCFNAIDYNALIGRKNLKLKNKKWET